MLMISAALTPSALMAHHSWIVPATAERVVEIGHGHSFPISEQAMNAGRIHITLISETGQLFPVDPKKESKRLTATIPPELNELAGAVFLEDPVIINRTPQGVKTGPMTDHKGVIDSFRRHRSSGYQSTPGIDLKASAGHLMLNCLRDEQGIYLLCRLDGKLLSEAEIASCDPGSKEERILGKTNAHGRLSFKMMNPGLHLFSVHWSKASTDSETKRNDYVSTLVVLIE